MGALATATPGASKVVQALASGKIANGWLDTTTVFAAIVAATYYIVGNVDATKRLAFQVDTQSPATTLTIDTGAQTASRTMTHPVLAANGTYATLGAQTFTGTQTIAALTLITDTTDATTTTTAAHVVAGGIAVGKRLCLDGATGKTIKYANGTANGAVAVLFGAVGPTGSTAGNAQGWIRIDVGGTDRYIPFW